MFDLDSHLARIGADRDASLAELPGFELGRDGRLRATT